MPIHRRDIAPYQERLNGPLKYEVRSRMNRLREDHGYTMEKLGKALGFSGPFISTLLREDGPASIRTKHMKKFMDALLETEAAEGIAQDVNASVEEDGVGHPDASQPIADPGTLESLVRAINSKGFAVTLWPLPQQ